LSCRAEEKSAKNLAFCEAWVHFVFAVTVIFSGNILQIYGFAGHPDDQALPPPPKNMKLHHEKNVKPWRLERDI
jgi:hypothetical protein